MRNYLKDNKILLIIILGGFTFFNLFCSKQSGREQKYIEPEKTQTFGNKQYNEKEYSMDSLRNDTIKNYKKKAYKRKTMKLDTKKDMKSDTKYSPQLVGKKLTILFNQNTGEIIKWPNGYVLRFFVMKDKMPENHYKVIKEKIIEACREWEKICNIKFQYRNDFDNRINSNNISVYGSEVDFYIRFDPKVSPDYAFANAKPMDERELKEKNIILYSNFFERTARDIYGQTGILIHEIGHVLGFEHEEESEFLPDYDCDKERKKKSEYAASLKTVGEFDQNSIMHSFCGMKKIKRLEFSNIDKKVIPQIYSFSN